MQKGRTVTPRVAADVPPPGTDVEAILELDRLFWLDLRGDNRKQYIRTFVLGEAEPHDSFPVETVKNKAGVELPLYHVLVQRWGRTIERWNGVRYTPVLQIVDNELALSKSKSHKRADRPEVDNPAADSSRGALTDYRFTLAGLLNERRRTVQQPKPMSAADRAIDAPKQQARQERRRKEKAQRREMVKALKAGKVSWSPEVQPEQGNAALLRAFDEGRLRMAPTIDDSGHLVEVSLVKA